MNGRQSVVSLTSTLSLSFLSLLSITNNSLSLSLSLLPPKNGTEKHRDFETFESKVIVAIHWNHWNATRVLFFKYSKWKVGKHVPERSFWAGFFYSSFFSLYSFILSLASLLFFSLFLLLLKKEQWKSWERKGWQFSSKTSKLWQGRRGIKRDKIWVGSKKWKGTFREDESALKGDESALKGEEIQTFFLTA